MAAAERHKLRSAGVENSLYICVDMARRPRTNTSGEKETSHILRKTLCVLCQMKYKVEGQSFRGYCCSIQSRVLLSTGENNASSTVETRYLVHQPHFGYYTYSFLENI